MGQVSPPPVNRPVRTRMPGGVGRAGERQALTRFRRLWLNVFNLELILFEYSLPEIILCTVVIYRPLPI